MYKCVICYELVKEEEYNQEYNLCKYCSFMEEQKERNELYELNKRLN